jgi:hypothetical protein
MSTHFSSAPATPALPHSGRRRAILGVLSITPIATAMLAFACLLVSIAGTAWSLVNLESGAAAPAGLEIAGTLAFALFVLSAASSVAAFVALVVDACTNPAVTSDQRPMWLLLLLLGNVLAFGPYWYVVWWRPRPVTGGR